MDRFTNRKYIIGAIILIISFIYVSRLMYLQIFEKTYKLSAESNSRRIEPVYPARGLIYDRNGELLVFNQTVYDLMIAPYELREFDTTELCEILKIEKDYLKSGIERAFNPKYRRDPFLKQITPEKFAYLQEKLFKYPGFYFRSRTLRRYKRNIAAHLFGYVGEVDEDFIAENSYYEMGDYYGVSGMERSYEDFLRGEKGRNYYFVDVHNKIVGPYQNGKYDKDATVGRNLVSTIDADLQEYGEKLMKNYKGSIVAIEPKTGEILAFISSPAYDPSLLVGRPRQRNYYNLQRDTLEPLFVRPLAGTYPPGSTFKVMNALAALQEGCVNDHTKYYCDLGYYSGRVRVRCHSHHSPLNLPQSIQKSCNAYYCYVFRSIMEDKDFESVADAFKNWRKHVVSFGFGEKSGIDLPYEKRGFVPTTDYYNRYYGENRWKALTIISMAIGQGEILTTPLQLTNFAAIIANKGYYIPPHIVKSIEGINEIDEKYRTPVYTTIDTGYFNIVIEGMELAVNGGFESTARIAQIKDIIVCGKTGTAQNPQGEDHSVFMAFAPKDDPEIAISVYVEHGKWGSSYAAPIASLMIEKYMNGEISPYRKWIENRMLTQNLLFGKN